MKFERNIGSIDRIIRLVVGAVLLSQVFVGLETPWGWLGAVLLATAAVRFCPPYALLGVSTCSASDRKNAAKKTQAA